VQIKNISEDTHAILRARAATAGMSLQEYLLRHLVDTAARRTLDEVLARAGRRTGGQLSLEAAADMIRAERMEH